MDGLSAAEPLLPQGDTSGHICGVAQTASDEAPAGALHQPGNDLRPDRASGGKRGARQPDGKADRTADGADRGREGADKGGRSLAPDDDGRRDFLKNAYTDAYVEILVDGNRESYKKQDE